MCKDKHFFLYFIFCEHFLAFSSLFLKFHLSSFMFNLSLCQCVSLCPFGTVFAIPVAESLS